jgi:hypothetical protein
MGLPAILRHIETDSGTLSGGSWQSTLPLANIRTQDIYQVARSTNATTPNTQFRIDFGTTLTRYLSLFLVLGHNLSTAATFRVTLGANADGSSPTYDSTALAAWRAVVVWGANPFGGFAWDGTSYPEGFVSPPIIRHKFPAVQAVGNGGHRYMHVYFTDTANAAGYVQLGRVLGGPVWQPEIGCEYGVSMQVVDPSEVVRTRGGMRIASNDARYRQARLRLSYLNDAEAWGYLYEWDRLGKRREVWFETDYDRADEIGDRRSMYAALAETSPITQDLFDRFQRDLMLEELT